MLEHLEISEQIPGCGESAIMARHMLRRLEDLLDSQLTELSREVTEERQRRATEVWGVSESEPTPEPAPNTIAAEVKRRKVIRCYVYLTADSQTWHCDRSCEEVRADPPSAGADGAKHRGWRQSICCKLACRAEVRPL